MGLPAYKRTKSIFALKYLIFLTLVPIPAVNSFAQNHSDFSISADLSPLSNNSNTITNQKLILRNSLLGVAEISVQTLSPLERSIFTDSKYLNRQRIDLGLGTVKLRRGLTRDQRDPKLVSVSLNNKYRNNSYLRFRFTRPRGQGRVFEITYNLTSKQTKLRHINLRALAGKICANSTHEGAVLPNLNASLPNKRLGTSSLKTFSVATDCDNECYEKLGKSSANDRIAEFFNSARAYYQNDLGYDLKITSQTTRTSTATYSGSLTDSSKLLDRFTDLASSLPKADLRHLLTGKNIDSNVVGLSYLGVVCSNPNFSLGFSQHFNDLLTPIIVAHEIGHNFNAEHDPKNAAQGIMTEILSSPYPTEFSTSSKIQISEHVNSLGSKACYDSEQDGSSPAEPTPAPKITIKYSGSKFSASSSAPDSKICSVEIHIASKESGLFSSTSRLASSESSGASNLKIQATNIKKVLLSNSNKKVKVYFGAMANCTDGTYYSENKSLNVGVVKNSSLNKNNTLKSARQWIQAIRKSINPAI